MTRASTINANNTLNQMQIPQDVINATINAVSSGNKKIIDELIPYNRKTLELLQDLENEVVKIKTN